MKVSIGNFSEEIKKRKGEYIVTNKEGDKILGTHKTRKQALKQLAAIEISKQQRN